VPGVRYRKFGTGIFRKEKSKNTKNTIAIIWIVTTIENFLQNPGRAIETRERTPSGHALFPHIHAPLEPTDPPVVVLLI
jgi:hypothetical protein